MEPVESRQMMSITFLDTGGPAANVGDDPRQVELADLNGDGKLDLITGNAQGYSTALGNGAGEFTLAADVNLGKQVLTITTADLNADGKVDMIVDEFFGDTVLFQGNGDGTFGAGVPFAFGDEKPRRNLTLADLNADGKVDVVAGIAVGTSGALVIYNSGTPGGAISFDEPRVVTSGPLGGDVTAADVNGDGRLDLVGVGQSLVVLVNAGNDAQTGRATFAAAATYPTTFINPNALLVDDLTGDGKPDAVVNYLSNDFDVLVNNGDGTFGAVAKIDQVVLNDGLADVDGDGKLDAFGANTSFGERFAFAGGNGDGTFRQPEDLELGNVSFNDSEVADVNGDGKPDVLIADSDEDRVVVLRGGAAATTPTPTTPTPTTPTPTTPTPTPDTTAAAADLAASAPTGLAPSLLAGQKGKMSVNVTNSGGAASSGVVTVKVYASADGVIDAGDTVLAEVSKSLKIAANKSKALPMKFTVPSVGDGAFQILTEIAGGGDAQAGNNINVAAAPINFSTPKVDLTTGLPAVQSTLLVGKKANVAIEVVNAGGAAVKAPATVTLFATTGGTLNGQEVQLATAEAPISLKAGKAKKVKLSFLVPAELTGQTRTLVARVQLAGDVDAANDIAAGGTVTIA